MAKDKQYQIDGESEDSHIIHLKHQVKVNYDENYDYYMKNIDKLPSFYIGLIDKWGEDNAVTDYIASMTDTFAVKAFEDLFVPNCWNI